MAALCVCGSDRLSCWGCFDGGERRIEKKGKERKGKGERARGRSEKIVLGFLQKMMICVRKF